MKDYPKQISYEGPRNLGDYHPEIYDLVEKLKEGLKFTMLAENIIQVEYPAELVWKILTVNVDNIIYRVDFLLKGLEEDRIVFFPNVHWNRKNFFMKGRFNYGKGTISYGKIVIEYPKLED